MTVGQDFVQVGQKVDPVKEMSKPDTNEVQG